jgi:hypothetical protein
MLGNALTSQRTSTIVSRLGRRSRDSDVLFGCKFLLRFGDLGIGTDVDCSAANCAGTGFSFNASPGASFVPSWINDKSSSWKCVAA